MFFGALLNNDLYTQYFSASGVHKWQVYCDSWSVMSYNRWNFATTWKWYAAMFPLSSFSINPRADLFSFLLSPSFYWPIKKEKVKWSPYLQTMDHKMIRIVKYFFQKNSSVSVVFKRRPYFSKNKTRFGTPVLYFWCFSLLNKKLYFFFHHYLKREFCLMFLIN